MTASVQMGHLEHHLKMPPALGKENAGGLGRYRSSNLSSIPVDSLIGSDSAGGPEHNTPPPHPIPNLGSELWGTTGTGRKATKSPKLLTVAATAREKLHARMSWILIAANWS